MTECTTSKNCSSPSKIYTRDREELKSAESRRIILDAIQSKSISNN